MKAGNDQDRDQAASDRDAAAEGRDRAAELRDRGAEDRDLLARRQAHTASDQDQTASDHDQAASGSDQRSADKDQLAADDAFAAGGDARLHNRGVVARGQSSRQRGAASVLRHETTDARLREHAEQASEEKTRLLGERDRAKAAHDREHAAGDRDEAAGERAEAFRDRSASAVAAQRALETLETMSDAFYTLDRDWRFTYVNPQSEPLLQRKPEELLGLTAWEVFPETIGSKFFDELQRAAREQVTVEFEEHYPPSDAWFAVQAHPTAEGLAVFCHDITAQRQLEAQLLQAQKLEAVGLLAGGVAHDFNNLLTVIKGYTEFAQSNLGTESPSLVEALNEIGGASGRAAALTAKLLAFSRTQPLHSTVADLNEIVSSALDLVEPLIGEHIKVHRRLEAETGNVLVDIAQIEQVIVNLAVNARDAMPAGGNLYVATTIVELDAGSIQELEPGTYVSLTVRDDGCGMDEPTRKRIFEPFFTTKPVDQGTGLGLSSAYGTISQSSGRIDATSTLGEGTTFTIHLPRSEEPVSPSPAAVSSSTGRHGSERILVVEDNDIVRPLLLIMLESYGYDVIGASNEQEALAYCASGRFDLMVTDLVMPGGDGSSLARAAVKAQPQMGVLFISGYRPASIANLQVEGSETAFLAKPFDGDELARNVRDILDATHPSGTAPPAADA